MERVSHDWGRALGFSGVRQRKSVPVRNGHTVWTGSRGFVREWSHFENLFVYKRFTD